MEWDMKFGGPAYPTNIHYAPIELNFFVTDSIVWSYGLPSSSSGYAQANLGLYGDRIYAANYCAAETTCSDGSSNVGVGSEWYFVDVYYPGVHSFDFHFTDPPGSGQLAPMQFSLVEQNFLADNTPVGSAEGFSLIIDPDGSIHDVRMNGMGLTGPGIPGAPEPASVVLVAVGLGVLTLLRHKMNPV
jgi:hypothetical protein